MCPNDNSPYNSPPAYHRVDCVFDSEEGSDITFLVGHEPETWRFPAHRSVLSKSNPVFKAMLEKPDLTISIPDISGRAFHILLRHLYDEEVQLQSVDTALCTLYAAMKYQCPLLLIECLSYLKKNLSVNDVLLIYHHTTFYSGQIKDPWAASAPPYELLSEKGKPINDTSLVRECSYLRHNCLLYIDSHADQVFSEENIEDVDMEALKELASRDTLCLSSECILYQALERWANRECKRRQLELTHENKRQVIDNQLLFSVRYLRMSSKEFYTGPMAGDLLSKEESTVLIGHILGMPVVSSVIPQETLKEISRPRGEESFEPPINTSSHSTSGSSSKKHKKTKKKKRKDSSSSSSGGRCTGACIADCILRALSCLFD